MTPEAWVYAAAFLIMLAAYLTVIHYWRRSINQRQALSRENHQLRMDLLRRGFDEQDAALGAQLRPALARGVRAAAEAQGKFFDTMRANPAAAENFRRLAESKPGPERLKARLGACAVDPDATDQGVCDVHGGPWTPGTDHCSYAIWWVSGARAAGADL